MISDRKGTMPFAVLAVSILLVTTCMAGMVGYYVETDRNTDEGSENISTIDTSAEKIRGHIESGLGEIIRDISVNGNLGGLEERSELFDRKVEHWLEFNNPISADGHTISVGNSDIKLVVERADNGYTGEGSSPAYLKAEGTVTLEYHNRFFTAEKEIDISSDGTCGLPLTLERTSLFESMTNGKVSLSNMISYQLSALAQYRIINGYGIGDKGVDEIITRHDVKTAYSNALEALSLICFRSDGSYFNGESSVDLADMLIGEDGIRIDLSSVYAQAIYSNMDSIVLKWFEYFCGDKIIHTIDPEKDYIERLGDAITSFIRGESISGAESYIREVMSSHGYSENDYITPGKGVTEVTLSGVTVSIDNPTKNLMDCKWIRYFKSNYYGGSDSITDFMRSVMRLTCADIVSDRSLGTVHIPPEEIEGSDFPEKLRHSLDIALNDASESLMACIESSISSTGTSDPFYAAIADAIYSHQEEFILEDEFTYTLCNEIEARSNGTISYDEALASPEVQYALQEYRRSVMDDLEVFDLLRDVPGGEPGMIKKVAAWMMKQSESLLEIISPASDKVAGLCDEWCSNISINPISGSVELPDTDSFAISGEDGVTTYEYLDARLTSNPVSTNPRIDENKSTFFSDPTDCLAASYTTVLEVTVYDHISYDVRGGSLLASSSGGFTSRCLGTVDVNLDLEIPVISGWALDNVMYKPSVTIMDEASRILLDVFEPLLEPLREIMGILEDSLEFLAEKLMVVSEYVAEVVLRMYEKIMVPIQELNEWIMSEAESIFNDATLKVLFGIGLGKQYIDISLFGYNLRLSTSAMTWAANTKTLLNATISGPVADFFVTAGITVKAKGDVKSENLIFTGNGSISKDDWKVRMSLDPLMKSSKHLLTLNGNIGDTDVSLVLPELVNYYEVGLSLNDIPGIGESLSCIPIPGLGVNIGLDAGFTLRYSHPVQEGLLINEFESNPPGDDRGNEWIELYNNTNQSIDLEGYTLLACSDRRTKNMTLSGTIEPGEYLVVKPTFLLVNQSGKHTRNGEAIALKNPEGDEIDKTPTMKDTSNDLQTIQRKFDGSTEWVLGKGTMGESNGSAVYSDLITASDAKDIVWYGVQKAFEDVGTITDVDTLTEFIRSLVKNTVDRTIKHVSGRILEASVYVSLSASDITSSASGKIRIAFRTDSELASDVLKAIAGRVEALVLGIKDPYRIQAERIVPEDVDLEICLCMDVGFPRILSRNGDMPKVSGDVVFRANIASLTRIVDIDTGKPSIDCGIRFEDVPTEVIPKIMKPNKKMSHDVWLFKLTVSYP